MDKRGQQGVRFPAHLARLVEARWDHLADGPYYERPHLPNSRQLRDVIEIAYQASMETDESRPVRFTLCATPVIESVPRHLQDGSVESWVFDSDRPFTVQELRRLASATDASSAAIWIQFSDQPNSLLAIHGLLNIGSSWTAARNASAYHYESLPNALTIQVTAPGRVRVYQGQFLIAALQSGAFVPIGSVSVMDLLGVYPLVEQGLHIIRPRIRRPKKEQLREWADFEWTAYVNIVLNIINSIQSLEHGGALVLTNESPSLSDLDLVKAKYAMSSEQNHLQESFIAFINLWHRYRDACCRLEESRTPLPARVELLGYHVQSAQTRLAEKCDFVASLSGTDGALILRPDLSVEGFGAEIRLDKSNPVIVHRVTGPMPNDRTPLDSEQFGMRHRSAMRLCSVAPQTAVFVASQDGGVSLVWNDNGVVCFRQNINTTNANMVLA